MDVLKVLMYGLHFIVSAVLIVLVAMQTHKAEGLGAMSGSSAPSLRGRAGVEEQLSTYTKYVAIAFMILSAILYMCSTKFDWA